MKITIVMGFFLPVPPAQGGATEKSWDRLATLLAERGHEVTLISRRWPGWPDQEVIAGVRHLRLGGFNHRKSLGLNLLLDAIWSLKVQRHVPPSDVTVIHAVTLPAIISRGARRWGKVVVMPGRIPKGQYRFYRNVDRVMATSSVVRDRVLRENRNLAQRIRVVGYPIDCDTFASTRQPTDPAAPVTIGYIGRIHTEKGVGMLAEAAAKLATVRGLPHWRLVLCGPTEIPAGGGGPAYLEEVRGVLSQGLKPEQWSIEPPCFDPQKLADRYRSLDLFCYPSLAAGGETFGVAIAEAMAAGAVPVVSSLACFRDLVEDGVSGRVFDHGSHDPAGSLCAVLAELLTQKEAERGRMRDAALGVARRYDFPRYVDALTDDLQSLLASDHGRKDARN